MATWQPHQQGLHDLLVLLREAVHPETTDQALVHQVWERGARKSQG